MTSLIRCSSAVPDVKFLIHLQYLKLNLVSSLGAWECSEVQQSVKNCYFFSRFRNVSAYLWNTYFQISESHFSFWLHQSHLLFTCHTLLKLLNLLWATAGGTSNSLAMFELYIFIHISLSTPTVYTNWHYVSSKYVNSKCYSFKDVSENN